MSYAGRSVFEGKVDLTDEEKIFVEGFVTLGLLDEAKQSMLIALSKVKEGYYPTIEKVLKAALKTQEANEAVNKFQNLVSELHSMPRAIGST